MAECAWKTEVRNQLVARDGVQDKAFRSLFDQLRQLSTSERKLKEESSSARRETSQLKDQTTLLQDENAKLKAGGVNNLITSAKIKELEDKLSELQQELTQSYKQKASSAETIIELSNSNKKLETSLAEREKELESTKKELQSTLTLQQELKELLSKKEADFKAAHDELQSLQGELQARDAKMIALERENKMVVEKMIARKEQEVEMLNENNSLTIEMARLQADLAKAREIAASATAAANAANQALAATAASASSPGVMAGAAGGARSSHPQQQPQQPDLAADVRSKIKGLSSTFSSWLSGESGPTGKGGAAASSSAAVSAALGTPPLGSQDSSMLDDGAVAVHHNMPPKEIFKTVKLAHESEMNCVTYSLRGSMIATGANDNLIKLWDPKTFFNISTLHGSVQSLMRVVFSENGELMLGASTDNTARLWSVATGRIKHSLTGHTAKIYGADVSSLGKCATGAHDRTLKVWDMSTGYLDKTMICFSSCNDISIARGTSMLVSGHFDNALRFWDLRTSNMQEEITEAHSKQITSVAFSPDGLHILTNGRDDCLKVFDVRTHKAVSTFSYADAKNGVNWNKACYSPSGNFAAVGGADGSVYVFNVLANKQEQVYHGHKAAVSGCAWSPDGTQLVSVGLDKTMVIYQ